jgi:hypothetical protein
MGDFWNGVDLGKLSRLAEAGTLYRASDATAATALNAANFIFWSGSSKGLACRLISVLVDADAKTYFTLGTLLADPGLAAGNPPVNLRLGSASAQAYNETNATSTVAPVGILASSIVVNSYLTELLAPAGIYLPPNSGVAIVTTAAAANCTVIWTWAENPRD